MLDRWGGASEREALVGRQLGRWSPPLFDGLSGLLSVYTCDMVKSTGAVRFRSCSLIAMRACAIRLSIEVVDLTT